MSPNPRVAGHAVSEQGRALGDPTRFAIFEQLRLASEPLGVSDLVAAFGLHPNAIRLHLGTLRQAGLVVEEAAPRVGRGRPPRHYRLSPGAIERWDSAGPHEELALMLLDMVANRRPAREVGRAAGERLAAGLSGWDGDPVGAVVGVARRLGFEPTPPAPMPAAQGPSSVSTPGSTPASSPGSSSGGRREVILRRCPFMVGAQRAPQVVCELHRGLAEGVLAVGSSHARVELVVRDPRTAGCSLIFADVTP